MMCYSCKKTHSVEDEVRWRDEFNVELFFSHIAPWIHAEFELPFLEQIKLQLRKKKQVIQRVKSLSLKQKQPVKILYLETYTVQTLNPNKLKLLKNYFRT